MEDILVSVIVPVYNVENYLRQCLDSITGQTLKNIEVICVDDSSTDSSKQILEEYAEKDERVKVITQPNKGAGAARNNGLSVAKGKYLSFLDSDWVTRECVELGLAAAKPWGHLGDIAWAINSHAQANGYSVVEDIGGHGIGLEFHEEPFVSYVTPKGSEMVLVPGMMFTIEPMINEGSPDFFIDEENGWTVYTIDDGLSAQVEYMVLVTETGVEVLTK